MRPQKLLVSLLALLVTISGAAALELTHKAVQDTVGWDGTAVYTLYVKNDGGVGESYRLKPASFSWGDVTFDEQVVNVFSGQSEPVTVKITPPTNVLRGVYDVQIVAISNSNPDEQATEIMRMYVNSELPHLAAEFEMPSAFAPTDDKFNVILKNVGTLALSGLTAELKSDLLPDVDNLAVGQLSAGQAALVWDKFVSIPTNTKPGKYDFTLTVFKDGEKIGTLVKKVDILGQGKVSADENIEKGFLSETHVVTLTNVGNVPVADSYAIEVPGWQRLFIHGEPKATVTKLGSSAELAWPYSLDLDGNTTVVYTLSYVPLLAALIASLVLLFALSWYYRQEFTILKEVISEADSKSMRVKLTIRNHAPLAQNNIIVEDAVPTPLKLVKEFATAEPTAIRREAGAMKVLWKFGTIYPGEERVLAYNLKSSLPIMGSLVLPEAKVRVRIDKQPKQFYSNRVTVEGKGVKVHEDKQVEVD